MAVHQQAHEVGAFAQYLRELVARLDPGRGWYGVFTRREPVGMRSFLDGVEIPPWDVVESLLATSPPCAAPGSPSRSRSDARSSSAGWS